MSVEIFRHRIAELARLLDKPELPINDAHVCSVCINESCWVHISYSEAHATVHWTALLGGTAGRNAGSLHRYLLDCNMNGALTAGGFFGVDAANGVVAYRYHEPLECLHTQRFAAVFETFSSTALYWRPRLASLVEQLPAAGEPRPGPAPAAPDGFNPLDRA